MSIDKNQPVILMKRIVTPNNNLFEARSKPYLPGELPEAYLTEEYCTQKGVVIQKVIQTTATADRPLTTMLGDGERRMAGDLHELESKPFTEASIPVTTVVNAPLLQINELTKDLLILQLPKIDEKTVTKLVGERKKAPFETIADLDARVPLVGQKWEEYKDLIAF